jgi:hypothetical protein
MRAILEPKEFAAREVEEQPERHPYSDYLKEMGKYLLTSYPTAPEKN